MKTVGLLRFSVLTPTYYSERFKTLGETAAHLFSPQRMDLRFRLFEKLCLPSLTRQSDADFDCVVLTAESMPAPYLERLCDLVEPFDNIYLLTAGTDKHYQLLRDGYEAVPADGCSHRIMFRLDDDDAVDLDFIRRTKRLAAGLLDLQGPDTPFAISYNRGFYVRATDDGAEVFDTCERAPLSAGLVMVARTGHPANPYRYNHRKLAQHCNLFSDISVPAFIRTIHGDNKSSPAIQGPSRTLSREKVDDLLARHFGIRADDLAGLV